MDSSDDDDDDEDGDDRSVSPSTRKLPPLTAATRTTFARPTTARTATSCPTFYAAAASCYGLPPLPVAPQPALRAPPALPPPELATIGKAAAREAITFLGVGKAAWLPLMQLGNNRVDARVFAVEVLDASLSELARRAPEWYNDDERLGQAVSDAVQRP